MTMCTKIVSTTLLLLVSMLHLAGAWLLQRAPHSARHVKPVATSSTSSFQHVHLPCRRTMDFSALHLSDKESNNEAEHLPAVAENIPPSTFTHADLLWKIRPFDASVEEQADWMKQTQEAVQDFQSNNNQPLPRVWIPEDISRVVLEAWHNDTKVARFGIGTQAGPWAPPIMETILDVYGQDYLDSHNCYCSAIVYMFVEPAYRSRNLGPLALQVIRYIQSTAGEGADFIVLVADDKGSGKLVEWYQRHGFHLAPKLQDLFGSPNQMYGVTMIGQTNAEELPSDCKIEWW